MLIHVNGTEPWMRSPHRFVLQTELPDQLPVISWIHDLTADKQLDLCMCSISLYSV